MAGGQGSGPYYEAAKALEGGATSAYLVPWIASFDRWTGFPKLTGVAVASYILVTYSEWIDGAHFGSGNE